MRFAQFVLVAFAALAFTACASEGEVDGWIASGEGIETPAIAESTYNVETNICPDQHSCGGDCTHVDCDGEPGDYFDCRYCGSIAVAADEVIGFSAGGDDRYNDGGDEGSHLIGARRAERR